MRVKRVVKASAPPVVAEESGTDEDSSDNGIVAQRLTVYYVILGVMLLGLGYLVGWTVGNASASNASGGNAQIVQAAVSTSIALLKANNLGGGPGVVPAPSPRPTEDTTRYEVDVTGSPSIGPDSARVTIVEFGDFQCPFCEQFFFQTEKSLLQQYAGKIRFVWRNWPLINIHPDAMNAANAAECAYEQNKFWEYHDVLYENQQQLGKDALVSYAKQLNLNMTAFQSCFDTDKYLQRIETDIHAAETLGLQGTPTFFINGRKVLGAIPLAAIGAFIDAELAAPYSPAGAALATVTPVATLTAAAARF
ncbi:MAG: DsbA family protein [Aggregatilineales bacterium]